MGHTYQPNVAESLLHAEESSTLTLVNLTGGNPEEFI